VKIARIDSHSIKVPYTFGGSHQGEGLRTWTTNNILLVRVETDTGIVGWGEAFCYACTDAVRAALHNMVAPLALGQDARDIARLSYDLQQKLHLFGRYGITIFALSGLDIALWDIAGKAANLPLHRLLGGAGHDSLPAYASLLKYRDPEKVAARAKQAFDQGYRHIKLHETEEAEVRVLSSCSEGTCGTCETAVLEGEPDHRDSVLTDEEQEANDCMMICVSRSRCPRLVLDL